MPPPRVSNSTGKINDLRDSFRHDMRCSEHRYSENFDAICNTSQDESSPWTTTTAFVWLQQCHNSSRWNTEVL